MFEMQKRLSKKSKTKFCDSLSVKSKSSFVRVPFEEVGKRTPSKGGY
jgi:hypothetical protein